VEIESKLLTNYCFLDPGSGKSKDQLKKLSARSAIVTISVDWIGRIYVRETWAARANTTVILQKIFDTHRKWKCRIFGIEANAQQSLFFDQIVARAREQGVRIPLQGVNQPTRIEKDFRIRSALQEPFARGQMFINHAENPELIEEIRGFPRARTKDLVDALASAVSLAPHRVPRTEVDESVAERLEYLREVGAPPNYIDRVAKGMA